MRIDFKLSGHGSVYLLYPLTRAARAWIEEHVIGETSWFAGALVVEHRYIGPIIGGAIGDGLRVQ